MQYSLLPVFVALTLLVFLGRIKIPRKSNVFSFLWLRIVVEVLFTGVFSPMLSNSGFNIPTESANYIARFFVFTAFIVFFYTYKINLRKFMGVFIFVLSLGMLIGVLQFFNWSGSGFFREAYIHSEHHLSEMNLFTPSARRVSGVANFATATGGIAAFTIVLILSMHVFHKKRRLLVLIGLFLAAFNIVVAQARMGYLTAVFSLIALYFVFNYVYKNGFRFFRSTFISMTLTGIVIMIIYKLYQSGNSFVTRAVYRWKTLGVQIERGGNRTAQIEPALSQIDSPFSFLFGISRGVEIGHMEIEPISIFVLYGAVGFVLMYSLVLVLLIYFFRNIRIVKQKPILLAMTVASFVGLLSYLFFSGAYWFFREVYVGLFPWILMGAAIGAIERFK